MKFFRIFCTKSIELFLIAIISITFLVPAVLSAENLSAEKKNVLVQIPLTGNLSPAGYAIKSGIELAINDNKDCPIQPIFDDNQYSPQLALSSLKNIYMREKVNALIIFGAPTSLSVKSYAEENKIPTIALSAASQLDSNTTGYIKRVWESADSMGKLIREEINKNSADRIAIVSSENDATIRIAQSIFENYDIKPVIEELVTPQETDFRSIATKIRQKNIDIVISNVLAGQHALLLSRLKEQSVKARVISQSSIFFDAQFRLPFPKVFDQISIVTVDDSAASDLYSKLPAAEKSKNSVFMTALAYDAYNWLCKKTLEGWDMESPLDISNYKGILPDYKKVNGNSIEPALRTININLLNYS